LKRDIFKYMQTGDELVVQPFRRLVVEKQVTAYEYDGFFPAMDTFKDKQQLDTLYEGGQPPWQVWKVANEPHPLRGHRTPAARHNHLTAIGHGAALHGGSALADGSHQLQTL
jgi:NDP-sugar pyrophosphorylase family protein